MTEGEVAICLTCGADLIRLYGTWVHLYTPKLPLIRKTFPEHPAVPDIQSKADTGDDKRDRSNTE